MSHLGDALFTRTQQQVLGLLYGQATRSFYTKEILRLTGMGVATIKRELDRMEAAGLLSLTKIGNQHHYQANRLCPIYEELLGIVRKTFGVADVIRDALLPLTEKIELAFIYGSIASGKETSASDIDLMIIGDIIFFDAIRVLHDVQESLGREVNPKIYKKTEWDRLLKNRDTYIKEVLSKPRIAVIGDVNEPG